MFENCTERLQYNDFIPSSSNCAHASFSSIKMRRASSKCGESASYKKREILIYTEIVMRRVLDNIKTSTSKFGKLWFRQIVIFTFRTIKISAT